jgi:hypothetical protein
MTKNLVKQNVDEIVQALRDSAGELDYNPQEARLFIQAVRLLAQGKPISNSQLEELGTELGLSAEDTQAAIGWIAERDDEDQIVGLLGLSLNEWNHTFKVNGKEFKTWCALDTLYLTPILQQNTEVESFDPLAKEPIRISVAPDSVKDFSPSEAVISIVIPEIPEEEQGLKSAARIWANFCSYSHYFISAENARIWFADKEVEPVLLSIDEGFELGRKWFKNVNKYA